MSSTRKVTAIATATTTDSSSSMVVNVLCVCFHAVRLLREELQLLQEPGSYVGEVIKVGWLAGRRWWWT